MQSRWILTATILASSMAFIDGTVVNVALPFLQKDLNATVIGVQWIVESYSLFLSALLLVGGSLGDRYGRRFIFTIGVVIFAIASAACGFAANIEQLIIARAVQGVGGALLVPGSLAIISASFDEDKRGKAIGTWSGFSAITTAIGPVLGGWLVEHFSWRAVFFLNLPLAFAVVVISILHIPESKDDEEQGHLDWLGAFTATLGLGGVVYGLIESPRLGFSHPLVVATLMGGAVALLIFLWNEAHSRNPMVPLGLFRSRNFAGANLITLLLYAALGSLFFFLALNLIQVQRYSATAAGASLLPFILLMFVLSRWSGGLVDRFGARLPLVIGPFVAAGGFVLFALPGVGARYFSSFLPAVLVLGFGMAVTVAPLTTTVMNSVHQEQVGVASGINNAVSRTAGLLAIAVFGVVMLVWFSGALNRRLDQIGVDEGVKQSLLEQRVKLGGIELPAGLDGNSKETITAAIDGAFVEGFRVLMLISAALAAASGLIAWAVVRSQSRATGQHGDQPTEKKA
jgi:EmrB/QacA subfamily drug resistance transporter